tara:strand:- start:295 stop:1080 length:786 start_codon:yes stop_codon:yes gene_type:complete
MEEKNVLAVNLQQLRAKHHLTTRGLAKIIGVSNSVISRWCRGISHPSKKHTSKLCDYFQVEPAWLVYGASNNNNEQSIDISHLSTENKINLLDWVRSVSGGIKIKQKKNITPESNSSDTESIDISKLSNKNRRILRQHFVTLLEYQKSMKPRAESFTNEDLNKNIHRFNSLLRLQDRYKYTSARKGHIDEFNDEVKSGDVYFTREEYVNWYPSKLSRTSMYKLTELVFNNMPQLKKIADRNIQKQQEENQRITNEMAELFK